MFKKKEKEKQIKILTLHILRTGIIIIDLLHEVVLKHALKKCRDPATRNCFDLGDK